jgi:mono/diheme cytochrome c family protein
VPIYPINDFGPAMSGMVIGGVGIIHVFLAQFAIGGGILLVYFEWLAQRGRSRWARRLVDSYFQFLVLVSFVAGAVTGVGMWLVSIQVSPRTIGLMVERFHWIWALEWTFFALEVAAGYTFYRVGRRLGDRDRLRLLGLYAVASWFSLFWINGILSWQLTPGGDSLWAGFFNPGFLPSLLYRTAVSMTLAALVACLVINSLSELDREARRELIGRAAALMAPMVAMPFLAGWYLAVIPDDSRGWLLGGSPAMTLFTAVAAGASLLIGAYGLFGILRRRLYVSGATALLLLALAFAATGAGEFAREGARKPFTVRGHLYANSITPEEVIELREKGSLSVDRYPLRDAARYPTDQLRDGARVFRLQCSVCHTTTGANGVVHLAGSWSEEQLRMNIAKLQLTKPFMPPFAGTAAEVEAVAQLVRWIAAGEPQSWRVSEDGAALERIRGYLEEAPP